MTVQVGDIYRGTGHKWHHSATLLPRLPYLIVLEEQSNGLLLCRGYDTLHDEWYCRRLTRSHIANGYEKIE
jgi:hypothetical protein